VIRPKAIVAVFLVIGSAALASATTGSVARDWSATWQPPRPVNGSPIVFRIKSPVRLRSLSGKWIEHDIYFSFDQKSKTWYGIAGVSLETAPGKYVLALNGESAGGKQVSWEKSVAVGKGKYRQIAINVPKQFTEPSPEQQQEIKDDQTLKHDAFAKTGAGREWSGDFVPPVKAQISDIFGTARTFNGKTQSTHQGLDYGVPSGTPVDALNRGNVILARPLFFEGNCVMLDHGQGLMTIYMHLSKIEVKEGDQVDRGQEIALSGGSGRATGPHLHVAVRWQGIYLDPATLLKLNLP
jgi:murein DD-endopeptidase MepM/ murein hydrolase activator NlpD